MIITDFDKKHLQAAAALALSNYEEQRGIMQFLPRLDVPDLSYFAENGLGAAAVDGDTLLGYICCWKPWDNSFDTAARGTFVPLHGHAAVAENRADIYRRMYQYAAKKWTERGIYYHGISLYNGDSEAIRAFFGYGFGRRCADAMRDMSPVAGAADISGCLVLDKREVTKIDGLRRRLSEHLGESPCFMRSTEEEFSAWLKRAQNRDTRLFVCERDGEIVAFLEVGEDGENFISASDGGANICGAFCDEKYRHSGLFRDLLAYAVETLRGEGIARLGVDYESFNPTASGFWGKHFQAYTCSVVRRIDEKV